MLLHQLKLHCELHRLVPACHPHLGMFAHASAIEGIVQVVVVRDLVLIDGHNYIAQTQSISGLLDALHACLGR